MEKNNFNERMDEIEKTLILVINKNKKQAKKLCRTIQKSNGQLKKALNKE